MKLLRKLCVIALCIVPCTIVANAAAAPNQSDPSTAVQPLIAYAYTTTCVVAGQQKTVMVHFQNTTEGPEQIIFRLYGASDTSEDINYKGPVTVVNALRSGLYRTATDSSLRWSFKLGAGQQIDKPVFLTIPPDSLSATTWDPTWGTKPESRFYLSGTANVRFSTSMQFPSVQPAYCK